MEERQTITEISGPLMLTEVDEPISYDGIVRIETPQGETKRGQVLESSEGPVAVQMFEGTSNIDRNASVGFLGETLGTPVTEDLLGRVLDGSGQSIDGGPEIVPDERRDIVGAAINPYSREYPREFIQTGTSAIDGMNTLVRGQKLSIFSASGLPHNDLALQITRQATVPEGEEGGEESEFTAVLGVTDITQEEANGFMEDFERMGVLERSVVFIDLADDPAVERTVAPHLALTTAEYLAFDKDYHVLVILIDMTNHCEALHEIGAAREEVPGCRGYPGYMYTDLTQLYKRAGRTQGRDDSVTQIPILTVPGDDDTYPVPDPAGYITEGQIYIDRDLNSQGIRPPISPLPPLSRLTGDGIGEDLTREDHADVSDQTYAAYAEGEDLRDLVNIVGREALPECDNKYLNFAERFEAESVNQGFDTDRSIEDTLDIGWDLLSTLPKLGFNRIGEELIEDYYEDDAGSAETEA